MIDFHNHLLPGVDDGASDLAESRAALEVMHGEGVRGLVFTPHLRASLTELPEQLERTLGEFDVAFASVKELAVGPLAGMTLERGTELMLDSPSPDLTDPRVRLAGTPFVLVEFPGMMVPPYSVQALYELRLQGWRPIVAHPERYRDLNDLAVVEEWRTVGCYLQLNAGSVVGRYGDKAERLSWDLLERGWIDYLCSDYHARGQLRLSEAREALLRAGAEEQVETLTRTNPGRLLRGEDPLDVSPVQRARSLWKRLLGRRR